MRGPVCAARLSAPRGARVVLAAGAFAGWVGGCAGLAGPPGDLSLRPAAVQLAPQNRVVGNAVVASYGGVAISLEPLTPDHLDLLYQGRPGLVNPLKGLASGSPPPVTFRVHIRNRGRQAVQVEPAQFSLKDQAGQRAKPMEYQDFYQLLSELPDAEQRLRSVQATTLSSFLTVVPGGERDGLVYFPPMPEDSRLVLLELDSLYIGGRELPLLAEFEVVRAKAGHRK